jgi:hypothetical protein
MSTTPDTLIAALQSADMLEIDDLHAWQFQLDSQQLAAPGASSAADQPLLSIECMDGRALRKWHFSLAQVKAARFDEATDSWSITGVDNSHRIRCFAAISGDNNEPADASNDD